MRSAIHDAILGALICRGLWCMIVLERDWQCQRLVVIILGWRAAWEYECEWRRLESVIYDETLAALGSEMIRSQIL
jgi:hypothetical protein